MQSPYRNIPSVCECPYPKSMPARRRNNQVPVPRYYGAPGERIDIVAMCLGYSRNRLGDDYC